MASAAAASPELIVEEVGRRLSGPPLNKETLVKLLKQAERALLSLGQSSSLETTMGPLKKSLVHINLLQQKDKDTRLLVAVCLSEIMRILAPNPHFSDDTFKDIFKLIISVFTDLADTDSPYFTRRLKILENIAHLRCCVIMLDIGCEDLVAEMFRVFFSVLNVSRQGRQQSLFSAMLSIVSSILEEKVSHSFLMIILQHLLKEKKDQDASFRLAVAVIQNCPVYLEPPIRDFLTSCILDNNGSGSDLKQFYHGIILEIFQYAPQMLVSVIPNLTGKLLTDQVDARLEAVHLIGKLLVRSKLQVGQEYRSVFLEFLKRFSDKSTDVRAAAIECGKACYLTNPAGNEADDILTAIEGRLLDFDDKVRAQAVIAVCDLAKSSIECFPPKLVSQSVERLRDKKVYVRRIAMQKLLELYQVYCNQCSVEPVKIIDHYEQIPCRVLLLCFDPDSKDFSAQNLELVLAKDLFPASLSIQEQISHWIAVYSFFTSPHVKALNSILTQKRRLQKEMQYYLALREKEKEIGSEEFEKRTVASFSKMSTSFPDSSKAKECFQKLHEMKDNHIFNLLLDLVNEQTTCLASQTIRDSFLRRIGDKHPNYDFLRILSSKCSYSIFTAEHVLIILRDVLFENNQGKESVQSSVNLLITIITMFPSLLRGSEIFLLTLFEKKNALTNENFLQILCRAGHNVSIKFSDVYSFLEQMCLEGTREEAKHAVSAIVSLIDSSDDRTISNLCKKIVNSLEGRYNISTLLQSLGYLSQCPLSNYELYEDRIMRFIVQNILCCTEVVSQDMYNSCSEDSMCSSLCKLKIYGLKALAKSFLPRHVLHAKHQMKDFLNILPNIIQENCTNADITTSEIDKGYLRLAAAKSVLSLAKRWDFHVSPKTFHMVVMTARDPSSTVRRAFLLKLHKLFKEHALPVRYGCSFALAGADFLGDIRADAMKYLTDFLKDHCAQGWSNSNTYVSETDGRKMTNHPVYVVVFLIHVLAHDKGFPSETNENEEAYAEFCSPIIFLLRALLNPDCVGNNNNNVDNIVSNLLGIFLAIKKAEDAVDPQISPKLHILSNIGLLILKMLGYNCKSSSEAPRLILLPSSCYKVCHESQISKLSGHNENFIDKDFVKRILDIFETPVATKPASSDSKQCGRPQEVARHFDPMKDTGTNDLSRERHTDSSSSRPRREKVNTNIKGKGLHKLDTQKVSSKGKHLKTRSTNSSRSSTVNDNTRVAPKRAAPICGKEPVSSSNSENIRPHPDSEILIAEPELEGCTPQELGGETLVGNRIRLWSPVDMRFESGMVDSYDSERSNFKVIYDSGNVELMHLEDERWEVIAANRNSDKGAHNFQPRDCSFYSKGHEKLLSDVAKPAKLQHRLGSSSSSVETARDVSGDKTSQKQLDALKERPESCNNRILPTVPSKGVNKRQLRSDTARKGSESSVVDESTNNVVRRTRTRRT